MIQQEFFSAISLLSLINQCQQMLEQINQHPDFQSLDYHPNCTLGDAKQALTELLKELKYSAPEREARIQTLKRWHEQIFRPELGISPDEFIFGMGKYFEEKGEKAIANLLDEAAWLIVYPSGADSE